MVGFQATESLQMLGYFSIIDIQNDLVLQIHVVHLSTCEKAIIFYHEIDSFQPQISSLVSRMAAQDFVIQTAVLDKCSVKVNLLMDVNWRIFVLLTLVCFAIQSTLLPRLVHPRTIRLTIISLFALNERTYHPRGHIILGDVLSENSYYSRGRTIQPDIFRVILIS